MKRNRIGFCMAACVAISCFLTSPAFARKLTPADYPLRVHIVFRNGFRHYRRYGGGFSSLEEVDGMGKANLFENSQPLGFDFTYDCGQPIMPQSAFATYMARWKKPGRVIEILTPVMGGKPGEMNSCDLRVLMSQGTVYVRHHGTLIQVPAANYQKWMAAHQYDPTRGMDQPVFPAAQKSAPAAP